VAANASGRVVVVFVAGSLVVHSIRLWDLVSELHGKVVAASTAECAIGDG
jgi:hypothetical protein